MAEQTIELIPGIDTKIVLDELYYTVKGAMKKLMRHENIKMTLDIYGHILDTDAEDAICKVYT